ncbi:radical SAM/SPASM domain-containing protein [Roseofilum casamattae]|uniref:Radical SAM protein n=1 Tax=Roseofilum casamattae BLCC-M143 TaxID=3022442 RepID=A0ABT7C2E9_9CYAN|nr:radical SAM protein [Roseofilum casamattae]MDJ1185242.1 radical SAM protein [Roseofilum casamattae BLCC-M143]
MNFASQSDYNVFIALNQGRTLAYNTKTQAFSLWDNEDINVYNSVAQESIHIEAPQLQDFVKGGYIVADSFNEKAEIESEYNLQRDASGLLSLTILPTVSCNFGCDYCTQGADKPHVKMLPEVQDAIVEFVKSKVKKIKALSVHWFGGEPLLEPGIIRSLSDRLLEICDREDIIYYSTMITNGWFLNAKIAQDLDLRQVKSIQITLDGSEEFHDRRRYLLGGKPTFQKIIQNIKEVLETTSLSIAIRINIDYRNKMSIIALIDDLVSEGLSGRDNLNIYFAPVESRTQECHGVCGSTMGKKDYGDLEVELYRYAYEKKLTVIPKPAQFSGICTALKVDDLVILPNGDLHKCLETVSENHHKVGSIFALKNLVNDPRYQQWLNWSPFQEKTCTNCKLLPTCSGSCAQKYLNPENLQGEAALPCPSWKHKLHEKLFWMAEGKGMVSRSTDWNDEISATDISTLKAGVKK